MNDPQKIDDLDDEQLDQILSRHRPSPPADFQARFLADLDSRLEAVKQDPVEEDSAQSEKLSPKLASSWFMRPQGMAMVAALAVILISFPIVNQMQQKDTMSDLSSIHSEPMTLGAAAPKDLAEENEGIVNEVKAKKNSSDEADLRTRQAPARSMSKEAVANNAEPAAPAGAASAAKTVAKAESMATTVMPEQEKKQDKIAALPPELSQGLSKLSAQWRPLGDNAYEVSAPLESENELKVLLQQNAQVELLETQSSEQTAPGRKTLRFKFSSL